MVTKVDSGVIVHDGGTIKDALDMSKPIADYVALRAYTGGATQVRITSNGISGFFYYDAADTTSADNGGTIIVASNGKRWKRLFDGTVNVRWFFNATQNADADARTGLVDLTSAIQAAINATKNGSVLFFPPGVYNCFGSIVLTKGSKIKGSNNTLVDYRSTSKNSTKIIFSSTASNSIGIGIDRSETEYGYVWGISIEDIFIEGANAAGSVGLWSRSLANSRFKNVGITRFGTGLKVTYGMLNTYESVTSELCLTQSLYMDDSDGVTTSQKFINCAFRDSPWGAVLATTADTGYTLLTIFDSCLFESTTVGGINVHRGCAVSFINPYFENVPRQEVTPDGTAIRLFFDGANVNRDTMNICTIYGGDIAGPNVGTFLGNTIIDVDYGVNITVSGTLIQRGTNGIRASANTKTNAINLQHPSFNSVSNLISSDKTKYQGILQNGVNGFYTRVESYTGTFAVGIRTDGNSVEIRNSANTSYYTLHSATDGANQALSAVGPAGASTSYCFKTQNSGTLQEVGRFSQGKYYKVTSNAGSYVVPNISGGSTDAFHHLISNSPAGGLIVSNLDTGASTNALATTKPDITNGSHYQARRTDTAAAVFNIAANGDVKNTNNSYGAISDIKLKMDIVDAGEQWDDIKAVRVRKYKLKDDPNKIVQIGVIAQELEQTSPGLVSVSEDEVPHEVEVIDEDGNAHVSVEYRKNGEVTKSVLYSVLFMKSVKALQEAMVRIELLESEVNKLKQP